MAMTKDQIRQYLEHGKVQNATHVIIVCDTFDWEDYPIFVLPHEDARTIAKEYGTNMQKVMEVYSLSHDWNAQLNESRAFHFD